MRRLLIRMSLRSHWQGMKDSNPQISLWRRAVCAISLIPLHVSDRLLLTVLERPAGLEPAYTSFVAKAINPLWHGRSKTLVGELRIELSPRAPKARMQRITPFPVVPAQRVERCSLRFQRSVSTAHTRLAKSGGPSRLCPDHLRIASAALSLNEL